MTFQEYLNQSNPKRQYNVRVTENDCFKTFNVHNGMVVVLYILNHFNYYLLPKNRHELDGALWTMDSDGNSKSISCFRYKFL